MNVSEQGLSNAHFNIPNGCLTKKLQRVKDRHKIHVLTRQMKEIIDFCVKPIGSLYQTIGFSENSKKIVLI